MTTDDAGSPGVEKYMRTLLPVIVCVGMSGAYCSVAAAASPGAKPHRARQGYAASLVGEYRVSMLGAIGKGPPVIG